MGIGAASGMESERSDLLARRARVLQLDELSGCLVEHPHPRAPDAQVLDAALHDQIEDLVHRGRLDELRRHLLKALGAGARVDQPLPDRDARRRVAHDREVDAGRDVRSRAVLDDHARAVGSQERELARVVAFRDEPAPGADHVVSGGRRGKVLDALADQAARRDAEESAGRGVRVDVAAIVIGDDDAIEQLVEDEVAPGATRGSA